jgi:hypothetical protein
MGMWAIFLMLIVVAAVLDAGRDTIYSHFSTSIFRNLNPKFWKALDSWQYARRIFGYPVDAWHLAKSSTLACFFIFVGIAIAHFYSITGKFTLDTFIFTWATAFVWVVVFNLFYNVVFRKKS